ncbi:MAG TPA: rRNA maturation RNase YbeY [Candidatus Dormibacteraeota bacterium]|nr:rRNA maturation RNase YbeY [Candidatus Dormibacteraeota bacterium]
MTILNSQKKVRLALRPLERFSERAHRALKLNPQSTALAFVTDAEIARLNKTYRKKSRPTDVLSFPAQPSTKRLNRNKFLGDIAIAPAVARRYAKKNGRTLESEICILILHGLLHLLGYDHETDRGQMDRVEHKLRRKLGLES